MQFTQPAICRKLLPAVFIIAWRTIPQSRTSTTRTQNQHDIKTAAQLLTCFLLFPVSKMPIDQEHALPPTEEGYSNAIILNNLGCVLLQNGAYREGFSTFRDAIDTLQNSSREGDDRTNDSGRSKIAVALRKFRATQRLHHNLDVCVIGFEDESIQNLIFETEYGKSMQVVITLRPQTGGALSPDVASAILLHNFALAHIFLFNQGQLQEREAHKSALYILRVAFKILFQKLDEMIDVEGYVIGQEVRYFDNFCGVVTVVLTNLVYTLSHQGFERAARDGYLQLRDFLENFSQSEGQSILGRASAAPAA